MCKYQRIQKLNRVILSTSDFKSEAVRSRCQILKLNCALTGRTVVTMIKERALQVGWGRTLNKVPEAGMHVTCADGNFPAWSPEADVKSTLE